MFLKVKCYFYHEESKHWTVSCQLLKRFTDAQAFKDSSASTRVVLFTTLCVHLTHHCLNKSLWRQTPKTAHATELRSRRDVTWRDVNGGTGFWKIHLSSKTCRVKTVRTTPGRAGPDWKPDGNGSEQVSDGLCFTWVCHELVLTWLTSGVLARVGPRAGQNAQTYTPVKLQFL